MRISLKRHAIEKINGAACSVIEYPINDALLDIAIVKISGRYPDKQRAVNQECTEIAYIFEGQGKIVINNQVCYLNTGDVVLIEAGEKYYWEGNMRFFLSCRPAWKKDQYKIVD